MAPVNDIQIDAVQNGLEMVQNGAESARALVPNMDGVMDEIKDLEAPENL